MKTNKTTAVPRLRFPEFRDNGEWNFKKLGKLAKLSKTKNTDEKVTRVFTNSAVSGVVDQQEYFKKDIANKSNLANYYVVNLDDFIYNPRISIHAPVGPISRNKVGKGVMSPLYTVFSFNQGCVGFYEQYFKTNHWHKYLNLVSNMGARHDRMNVSRSDFLSMPLPYPVNLEQQKIAACLSSLDDSIDAEIQQLDSLKAHKAGLLQNLFPVGEEITPNYRFAEFKDDGDWEKDKLESVTHSISSGKDNKVSNGDYLLYGSTGIIGKTDKASHIGSYILVARVGANAGLLNYISGKFGVSDNTLVISIKKTKANINFIYYFLTSFKLNKLIFGSGQPLITGKQLKLIELGLPSVEEQQKIADSLSSLDNFIEFQDYKIKALKKHKQGLMQQLFPMMDDK